MRSDDASAAGGRLRTLCWESESGVRCAAWGEIDIATSDLLAQRVGHAIALASPTCPLTLDLRDVTFLGAAGLRVLTDTQAICRAAGIDLVIAADQPAVLRPLAICGLDEELTVVPR